MNLSGFTRISFVFLLISISFFSFSQVNKVPNLKLYDFEPYHFGFILAANQMNFSLEVKDNLHLRYYQSDETPDEIFISEGDSVRLLGIESLPTIGFSVGIVGDLRVGNYFDLRFVPSLSFGRRYLQYRAQWTANGRDTTRMLEKSINSTFMEFPFYLKYKSKRVNNMRAYVYGGVKFSFDLASQANKDDQNDKDPKLFRTDTYGELGAGLDFYMNWFKFGVQLSMSYGARDMLERDGELPFYVDGIKSLRSKIFMFTFTFE